MIKVVINKLKLLALKRTLEKLKAPVDEATAKKIGKTIVAEMKGMISQGISPIKEKGRFPAYKNRKKYPGDQKKHRPVNLRLSGDMLKALESRAVPGRHGFDTEVGYFDDEQSKKEQGHREGVNSQPKRPTIPQGSETFAEKIRIAFSRIYRERIKKLKAKAKG